MSQTFLRPEWLKQLADPFAVLGISVAADERQILKRYHALAKFLQSDRAHQKSRTRQGISYSSIYQFN
ncbi:MAG: hypothetical protein ACHBN1_18980 [Heteroscytonema crispum UTEX LB 1556]